MKRAKILKDHSIGFKYADNGNLLADNEDGTFTDVTHMGDKAFKQFLGY